MQSYILDGIDSFMTSMIEKCLQDQQVIGLNPHTLITERGCLKIAGMYKSPLSGWKKEDVNGFILWMQKKYSDEKGIVVSIPQTKTGNDY